MDLKTIQFELNSFALVPKLAVDGIMGRETLHAMSFALHDARADDTDWSGARQLIGIEQLIYHKANIEVGTIDGYVGEQTRYARTVWDARHRGDPTVETWRDKSAGVISTKLEQRAWPKQKDCAAFFGAPGTNLTTLNFPYPMRLAWAPETNVYRTQVNIKCLQAFTNIFGRTLDHYGHERVKKLRLDMFGGCFNNRKMRGGSSLSMHAFAIAMDIDPDRNQLKMTRDLASLDAIEYEPFWGFVETEGGLSLGRVRNFDWMHFQFARL